ncbi:protein-cysteine N-palmitoyltransferase Rasp isoform X2 [Planococcus citri]|uniref:protein-cysteine N-palmitoyltransferase Rasp isoform X2 n=1 Tax=Planococcus citri TaxID=170843 RepID=UPI0031F7836D
MISTNKLSKSEVYFYFLSWTVGIFYSVYHVYIIGNKFIYLFEYVLGPGWSFLNRKKDKCDDEWEIWVDFIINKLGVWILIHHLGARILNTFCVKVLPSWYFLITSAFLVFHYDIRIFLIFLFQPVIFSVFISITKSKILLWIFCYVTCSVSSYFLISLYDDLYNEEIQLMSATLMWIYLRSTFSIYLPFFWALSYSMMSFMKKGTYKSCGWLIFQNLRYFAWLYFTEFLLHFVYINCQQPYTQLLIDTKNENVWIMYGIGFAMGQFFFLKYTVVYGLALTWTKAEGYETPNPPKCIARIYLYSEMWRTFDHGLYIFIKKYIFDPCVKFFKSETLFCKVWVSFVCFAFIYIWHGQHYFIFMWSFLNYCGIMTETIARRISKTTLYFHIKNWLGPRNERRCLAFIAAPLTIISAISNFYFIGGVEVAESYLNFFYKHGTYFSLGCLWFFVYALCHVSMELSARENLKRHNLIHKL